MSSARNWGCRVSTEYTYKGMRTAVLENEVLRIGVLTDKGSDIFQFLYKPNDVDFMYLAPRGIQNPRDDIPSIAGSAGTFLDYYSGGWQEILPNGGPPATYRGAEFGQHGEISLVPWEARVVDDRPERVAVKLWVRARRVPLLVEKELSLETGRGVLTIAERVTNESPQPVDFMWGHHPALGGVLLEPGCIVDAPARTLLVQGEMTGFGPRRLRPGQRSRWPMAEDLLGNPVDFSRIPEAPTDGAEEVAYLTDLDEGWFAVTHPGKEVGFALAWDKAVFPYLWFWQELRGGKDYPWWGQTHTIALEPWTSYPTDGLEEAMRNGTHRRLEGGESLCTTLRAVAYQGVTGVKRVTPAGDVIGRR